jgi:hypothetical protein
MHNIQLNLLLDYDFDASVRVRLMSYLGDNYHLSDLSNAAGLIFENNMLSQVLDTLNYVSTIDYVHPGLNSLAYLDHPLRVASMAMFLPLEKIVLLKSSVLALAHNSLETSTISKSELQKNLGTEIADAVSLLTVDRSNQYDSFYKDKYYEKISESSEFIKVVKVLDKLDNIFTLGMNSNKFAKDFYIFEIKKYVLPLCDKLPDVLYDKLYSATKKISENPHYLKEYPEYELLASK